MNHRIEQAIRRAEKALGRYTGDKIDVREEPEGVMIDIVADLMHYADARGLSIGVIVQTAAEHHAEETREEASQTRRYVADEVEEIN